jgi:hypothetical protein
MASGYLPPHKRNEVEKKSKGLAMNCRDEFPDLSLKGSVTTAWGSKTSFSQKIKDLIANEQKTEAEREAEREAARAIERSPVLDIRPFTKERYILFNERIMGLASFAETQKIKIETILNESAKHAQEKINNSNNETFVELAYDSPSEDEEKHHECEDDQFEQQSDEPYENSDDYEETYDKYY